MNLQDIHYVFPGAAYFILIAFLFAWLFRNLYLYRKDERQKFGPEHTQKIVFNPSRSRTLFAGKTFGICMAWIFASFALMQPISYGHYPEELTNEKTSEQNIAGVRKRKAHEVILLIDASSSMAVSDARNNKTRFDTAKEIGDDIISRLQGESVSLQTFSSVVSQLSPITIDYLFVRLMLRQANINEGGIAGTDITNALTEIKQQFFPTPSPIIKTIILISDGGDTHIESLQGTEKTKAIQQLLIPLQNASKNYLRVITIGVGARTPSPIPDIVYEGKSVTSSVNEELLKLISQIGRGKYYFANDYSILNLAAEIVKGIDKEQSILEEEDVNISIMDTSSDNLIHKHFYHLPLGIAILLLGCSLVLQSSWIRRKAGK